MRIYDISQEIEKCEVYPTDPTPSFTSLSSIERGDLYNLTSFSMCAHNGTHIDAPAHFIAEGKTVGELDIHDTVGPCYVAERHGILDAYEAKRILDKADRTSDAARRILIKGSAEITADAAEVFRDGAVRLIGVESQSVGPIDAPMEVHKILLGEGVVLLEGVRLGEVEEGYYTLFAAPINLGKAEGAPCRAILIGD